METRLMKKYFLFIAFALFLTTISTISSAQTSKTIALKDGSFLKGEVVQLNDGVYTIETSNLGRIAIPESDILSITSAQADKSQNQKPNTSQKKQIQNQVEAMQGSILSDPALMMEIQNIVNDPEVQALLTDPTLLDDVLTYDPEKIEKNNSAQDLIQNPKIQNLINKIQQKESLQE